MSGGFLDRWSRRKLASAGKALLADAPVTGEASAPVAQDVRVPAGPRPAPAAEAGVETAAPSAVEAQLPAVEELTLASDFTAFLKDEVSEALRRKALQKLFADPHFNRMDGLDIYIDDYSLPDPIPPEAMAKLKSAREWLMANEVDTEAAAALPAGRTDADDVLSDAADDEERDARGGERLRPEGADAPVTHADERPAGSDVAADARGAREVGREPGTRQPGTQEGVAREGALQQGAAQQGGGAFIVGDVVPRAVSFAVSDKPIESGQKAP